MKKIGLLAMLFAVNVFAATNNWQGTGDTAIEYLSTTNECTTRVFSLTDYDYNRLVVAFKDTSNDDFASDSTVFYYWFQTGSPIYNSSGSLDTAWDNKVVIDSVDNDNFGTNIGYMDSTGTIYRSYLTIDTAAVSGYAFQSRNFAPEWDVLIRFGAKGLTGNKIGSAVKIMFTKLNRLYDHVRQR